MKAFVSYWFAAVIFKKAWTDISYILTHHPVPLQFVDQRCQTATGRFAFSIHHLKQAAGHSAFHHCSKTKPGLEYKSAPKPAFSGRAASRAALDWPSRDAL